MKCRFYEQKVTFFVVFRHFFVTARIRNFFGKSGRYVKSFFAISYDPKHKMSSMRKFSVCVKILSLCQNFIYLNLENPGNTRKVFLPSLMIPSKKSAIRHEMGILWAKSDVFHIFYRHFASFLNYGSQTELFMENPGDTSKVFLPSHMIPSIKWVLWRKMRMLQFVSKFYFLNPENPGDT